MWEQLRGSQPGRRDSPNIADGEPPGPATNVKDNNGLVEYPILSVSSPFPSQITDHGRQPDFSYEDSANGM